MTSSIINEYNAIAGLIIATLTFVFGEHWVLFAAFLAFNFTDWITGWYKSRRLRNESSRKGLDGVLKKFGYWIMIGVAFLMSVVFIEIGRVIGIDLHITTMLGWFVLASLMVNELRSIIENLVDAGFEVPYILVKGLEIADKTIDGQTHIFLGEEDEEDEKEKEVKDD